MSTAEERIKALFEQYYTTGPPQVVPLVEQLGDLRDLVRQLLDAVGQLEARPPVRAVQAHATALAHALTEWDHKLRAALHNMEEHLDTIAAIHIYAAPQTAPVAYAPDGQIERTAQPALVCPDGKSVQIVTRRVGPLF